MKILVDEMPVSPDDCPFAEANAKYDLMVCTLKMKVSENHTVRRVHCACKPAYCPHLIEHTVRRKK